MSPSSPRVSLHPRVKATTPAHALYIQLALRWAVTAASSVAALLVGAGVDTHLSNDDLPAWWWASAAVAVIIAGIGTAVATYQSLLTQNQTEVRLQRLAQESWNRLGHLRTGNRTGQLLDIATNGATRTGRYRGGFMVASIAQLSTPIVVCVLMGLFISWPAAGIMTALVILGPLLIGAFQSTTKNTGTEFRESQAQLRASFLEGISALESLSYAGAAQTYARHLAEENETHRRRIMRLLLGNQTLIVFMDLIFALGAFTIATALAVSGVQSGAFSTGSAISLILLTVIMVAPIDLIGQFFYIGIGGRAAQRQFSDLVAEAEETPAPTGITGESTVVPSQGSSVTLDHVSVGWEPETPILSDVTVHIHQGEHIGLVGPSGSGKSTLSALIQGQLSPISGTATVCGMEVKPGCAAMLRKSIATVEQRTFLFNDTVAGNLRIARPDATDAELLEALRQAHVESEILELPQGLNTMVGDHGSRLSGGQAQRLAIARAFLKDAPLLILDEPTSQVDLAGESHIVQAISSLAQGRTVITIAHRQTALLNADRVLTVELGTVR